MANGMAWGRASARYFPLSRSEYRVARPPRREVALAPLGLADPPRTPSPRGGRLKICLRSSLLDGKAPVVKDRLNLMLTIAGLVVAVAGTYLGLAVSQD